MAGQQVSCMTNCIPPCHPDLCSLGIDQDPFSMTLSMLRQPPKLLGAGLLAVLHSASSLKQTHQCGQQLTCLSSRTIITGTEQA